MREQDGGSGAARQDETIIAPATPPGRGALAIVRVSGPRALDVLSSFFRPMSGTAPGHREARLGNVFDRKGRLIDQAVATCWFGPRSYTGEDLAEVSVHGSPAVVREIVEAGVEAGARRARPGEFTLRAIRSGRLDLARAEAVRDLVEAATAEQAHVAARQLAGEVSDAIGALAERIVELLADVEAGLDFSEDEDLGPSPDEVSRRSRAIAGEIDTLLRASETGRRIREGVRVVLTGPPNAGKSSLFNRLVGSERVIVTPEPGTTRDTIEETVVIGGLPVVLVDSAGVRESGSQAERAGVERALEARRRADLVLQVYPLHCPERPQPPADRRILLVGTHADLPLPCPPAPGTVQVSSLSGRGVDELRGEIAARLEVPGTGPIESVALATGRHREAASRASRILSRLAERAAGGLPAELAALELREAAQALREILGEVSPDDLLGRIFSRFCIGK